MRPAPASHWVLGFVLDLMRSRAALVGENSLLRKQLEVACRLSAGRPLLRPRDRLVLCILARLVRSWRSTMRLVQPATVLRWHREGYRALWRRRSRRADPSSLPPWR